MLLAVSICFTVLYCTTDTSSAIACLFESVSAFSTTGLSAGATADAGIAGKAVLVITMFIGRVGPVSLIMSLTLNSAKRKNVVVPEGQIIIG